MSNVKRFKSAYISCFMRSAPTDDELACVQSDQHSSHAEASSTCKKGSSRNSLNHRIGGDESGRSQAHHSALSSDIEEVEYRKKIRLQEHYDSLQHPPAMVIPLMAALASMVGITAAYPFSLIRAKMQAQFVTGSSSSAYMNGRLPAGSRVTAIGLVRTILRADGPSGLYRGLGTNLVKVLPSAAISLATYEAVRKYLHLGPMGSG